MSFEDAGAGVESGQTLNLKENTMPACIFFIDDGAGDPILCSGTMLIQHQWANVRDTGDLVSWYCDNCGATRFMDPV